MRMGAGVALGAFPGEMVGAPLRLAFELVVKLLSDRLAPRGRCVSVTVVLLWSASSPLLVRPWGRSNVLFS
eukprot:8748177-Lingulodinium_polyedra.AAC.1